MELPLEIWRSEISRFIPDAKSFFNYSLVIKHIPEEIIEAKKTEFSKLAKDHCTKWYELPNKRKHGIYTKYECKYDVEKNPCISSIRNYVDGKLHGEYKDFCTNGTVRHIINFKKGIRDGLCQDFDLEGKLYHSAMFENDNVIWQKYERENVYYRPSYMIYESFYFD